MLLAPTSVQTHTGSITRNGAPRGACSATSGAGALDTATHHRWRASFSASLGDYFVTNILGDVESGKKFFWGIWIDDRFATTGPCGIKLHRGDRLLFAAVPATGPEAHPINLTAPSHAVAGHAFTLKVVWFSDAGVPKPLAGARVSGGGVSTVTNSHGIATIVTAQRGTLVLHATDKGYIRAAPVRVRVTP